MEVLGGGRCTEYIHVPALPNLQPRVNARTGLCRIGEPCERAMARSQQRPATHETNGSTTSMRMLSAVVLMILDHQ